MRACLFPRVFVCMFVFLGCLVDCFSVCSITDSFALNANTGLHQLEWITKQYTRYGPAARKRKRGSGCNSTTKQKGARYIIYKLEWVSLYYIIYYIIYYMGELDTCKLNRGCC